MAKGFCILRVAKLKQAGGVAVALGHNTRERETSNASPELKDKNKIMGPQTVEAGMSRFRDLVSQDKTPRKNAVLCLDYLITATNEALTKKGRDTYLDDALTWIRERHGAENVLQVAVHRDEQTDAHMHVLVVPIALDKANRKKLKASKWLDGSKKLSEMQTDFAQKVGSKHDLARGIEGSKAKHETVKRFYGLLKTPIEMPQIEVPRPPKLGAIFDLGDWQKRATELVITQIKPAMDTLDARSRKLKLVEKDLRNTKATLYKTEADNRELRKENTRLQEILTTTPLPEIQKMRDQKVQENQKQDDKKRGNSR